MLLGQEIVLICIVFWCILELIQGRFFSKEVTVLVEITEEPSRLECFVRYLLMKRGVHYRIYVVDEIRTDTASLTVDALMRQGLLTYAPPDFEFDLLFSL